MHLQVGKQNVHTCIKGIIREFNISSIRQYQFLTSCYIVKHKESKLKLNEKYSEIRDIINSIIDYDNPDVKFTIITPYVEMKKKDDSYVLVSLELVMIFTASFVKMKIINCVRLVLIIIVKFVK